MLYVLSPSKTLDESSPVPRCEVTQPALLPESGILLSHLRTLSEPELAALMDISPKLAALNHARYRSWFVPFTRKNARPALFTFKGDVYDGLDAATLSAADVAYVQSHLRILSGLYGVLRPLDLMQPYRLEMGTSLANPRGRNLYQFWGERITQSLNLAAEASGADLLINLASQEYAAVIDRKALKPREVTVHFKEKRGNKLQVIGLMAKRARGMMARYLVTGRIETIDGIRGFTAGGYRFDAALSDAKDLIFVR